MRGETRVSAELKGLLGCEKRVQLHTTELSETTLWIRLRLNEALVFPPLDQLLVLLHFCAIRLNPEAAFGFQAEMAGIISLIWVLPTRRRSSAAEY